MSSSAYHSLRTSGFVQLSSLSDYTHFIKSKSGFYSDQDNYLVVEADLRNLPEWKQYIIIVLDELKLKESLVYDKWEAKVIGFVDIGDINNHLSKLEQDCSTEAPTLPVATHMLVLMIKAILTSLEFPYTHFPTSNLTGEQPCLILWEAIERLEHLDFKVLPTVAPSLSDSSLQQCPHFYFHVINPQRACTRGL